VNVTQYSVAERSMYSAAISIEYIASEVEK